MPTTNVTDAELAEIDRAACAGTVAAQHPSALLAFRVARDLATLRGLVREFEVASKGHKATTAAEIADRMFAAVKT